MASFSRAKEVASVFVNTHGWSKECQLLVEFSYWRWR